MMRPASRGDNLVSRRLSDAASKIEIRSGCNANSQWKLLLEEVWTLLPGQHLAEAKLVFAAAAGLEYHVVEAAVAWIVAAAIATCLLRDLLVLRAGRRSSQGLFPSGQALP